MNFIKLSIILNVTIWSIYADQPIPAPQTVITKSLNGKFGTTSTPNKGTVCINLLTSREAWRIPSWHRKSFLCNDGIHFISCYDGLNLIPDIDDKLVLFTFWKNGKILRKVTLSELFPDKTIIMPTASNYYWGNVEGLDKNGHLKIILCDYEEYSFDPSTGLMIKTNNQDI